MHWNVSVAKLNVHSGKISLLVTPAFVMQDKTAIQGSTTNGCILQNQNFESGKKCSYM